MRITGLCFLLLTCVVSMNGLVQAAEQESPFEMCSKGNASNRNALSKAQGMPEGSRKLASVVFDDRICQCIKGEDAKVPATVKEPIQRYFAANSVCMAAHVQKEFPDACPLAVKDLLASVTVTANQVTAICDCAVLNMRKTVTPEALLTSQREQYRYFSAVMADRQNGTSTAAAMTRPGPGPYELSAAGIVACGKRVLGDNKR